LIHFQFHYLQLLRQVDLSAEIVDFRYQLLLLDDFQCHLDLDDFHWHRHLLVDFQELYLVLAIHHLHEHLPLDLSLLVVYLDLE
jgi:hypothetical protein